MDSRENAEQVLQKVNDEIKELQAKKEEADRNFRKANANLKKVESKMRRPYGFGEKNAEEHARVSKEFNDAYKAKMEADAMLKQYKGVEQEESDVIKDDDNNFYLGMTKKETKRIDAEDEGWRTTEGGHKIKIGEGGEIVAGNPKVIAKMTGEEEKAPSIKSVRAMARRASKLGTFKPPTSAEVGIYEETKATSERLEGSIKSTKKEITELKRELRKAENKKLTGAQSKKAEAEKKKAEEQLKNAKTPREKMVAQMALTKAEFMNPTQEQIEAGKGAKVDVIKKKIEKAESKVADMQTKLKKAKADIKETERKFGTKALEKGKQLRNKEEGEKLKKKLEEHYSKSKDEFGRPRYFGDSAEITVGHYRITRADSNTILVNDGESEYYTLLHMDDNDDDGFWFRTKNGTPIHINKEGEIDGGAGGSLNGKEINMKQVGKKLARRIAEAKDEMRESDKNIKMLEEVLEYWEGANAKEAEKLLSSFTAKQMREMASKGLKSRKFLKELEEKEYNKGKNAAKAISEAYNKDGVDTFILGKTKSETKRAMRMDEDGDDLQFATVNGKVIAFNGYGLSTNPHAKINAILNDEKVRKNVVEKIVEKHSKEIASKKDEMNKMINEEYEKFVDKYNGNPKNAGDEFRDSIMEKLSEEFTYDMVDDIVSDGADKLLDGSIEGNKKWNAFNTKVYDMASDVLEKSMDKSVAQSLDECVDSATIAIEERYEAEAEYQDMRRHPYRY